MNLLATKNMLSVVIGFIAVALIATSAVGNINVVYGQKIKGKEDVFKVIVTLFGVEPTTGDIVSFVTVNNISKVKTFNAATHLVSTGSTQTNTGMTSNAGIVELYFAFPNATIKSGDEFRVCNMVLKDLRMICETGENTPALRAENVDMYLDTAKFLKAEDMKGESTGTEATEDEEGDENAETDETAVEDEEGA